ncbi:MAG: CBS domain-containing protein [Alphaproteobacteria bacterium]|jgi:CBS domain-containing protein|nr:CBS domain-containing protein [Alphaproteobacteria bacterium]
MQVKSVMSQSADWLEPSLHIREAARRMRDEDIGILPIGEDDQLVGMVTDRDLVIRALPDGKDVEAMTVRDAMTDKILYCYEDEDVAEVAENMGRNQVRRLPVLNRDKRLVGMVTIGDIARQGEDEEAGEALRHICKES